MFRRHALCGLLAAAAIVAQSQPTAAARTYSQSESEALQCAADFSYTSHVFVERGLMTARHRDLATRTSYYILRHHVSGPFDQKLAAYEGIIRALPLDDLTRVEASAGRLGWCEQKFLQG